MIRVMFQVGAFCFAAAIALFLIKVLFGVAILGMLFAFL